MKVSYCIIGIAACLLLSCKSHKEVKTASTATPATTTASKPSATAPAALSTEDLVKAAQAKWPDVTAQTINDGKYLYTSGACINCHGPKNIVKRSMEEWPSIVDEMAIKAHITDVQKDAVLKYVLAVKMASKS